MNALFVGKNSSDLSDIVRELSEPFLYINDTVDGIPLPARTKVTRLDISKDSFNPLQDIDYRRARNFAEIVYAASPQGQNTLTVRNGKRALAKLILNAGWLDRLKHNSKDPDITEANNAVDDILFSPVLKHFLCNPARTTNFSLEGIVLVQLDRATLTDFDAFLMGNLLIAAYQGQIVVPDFGFYACPFHTSLVRQERLIAGVQFLDQVPFIKDTLLLMDRKEARTSTVKDAKTLASFAGLRPDPLRANNDYEDFIDASIA